MIDDLLRILQLILSWVLVGAGLILLSGIIKAPEQKMTALVVDLCFFAGSIAVSMIGHKN